MVKPVQKQMENPNGDGAGNKQGTNVVKRACPFALGLGIKTDKGEEQFKCTSSRKCSFQKENESACLCKFEGIMGETYSHDEDKYAPHYGYSQKIAKQEFHDIIY
ncbi:MAG: hypothetical protein WCY41_02175 [Candidatus Micrarchaeia archaeon]